MRLTLLVGSAAAVVLLSSSVAALLLPREPLCSLNHGSIAETAAGRALDPLHAARDLAEIEREAAQFGKAVAKRPMASDSIDAKEGARTAPMRAVAWCRVTLMSELADLHGTSTAALQEAASGAAQAEADAASRVDATSPVVSRPSR